jgi:hypothetical protein
MESAATSSAPSNPQSGPEASSEAPKPATTEKALYGGQEMELDALFRTKKHKAKVDGKEMEVDYDELVKGYGHNTAANARMREAAELKKATEAREKALYESIYGWKTNPASAFEALEKLGIDVDSISHERVLKKMQYEMMSPEQREAFDAKRELETYRQREKREAEERKQQELAQMQQKAVTDLEQGIVEYLGKSSGPVDPALVGRAVDEMISAMEHGQELSIEQAFQKAGQWFETESKSIFDRQLKALLAQGQVPKELAEIVRKADVDALRKKPPERKQLEATSQKPGSAKGIDDFFNDLDKRFVK